MTYTLIALPATIIMIMIVVKIQKTTAKNHKGHIERLYDHNINISKDLNEFMEMSIEHNKKTIATMDELLAEHKEFENQVKKEIELIHDYLNIKKEIIKTIVTSPNLEDRIVRTAKLVKKKK